MREYLNADSYANTARMLRIAFNGPICVFEGSSDRNVYIAMFDMQQVRHLCVGPLVAAVVHRLNATATAGVIGIMDADFCRLEENYPTAENLFLTDDHDLEVGLIFSGAFSRVVHELGSEEKLKRAMGNGDFSVLQNALLKATTQIGSLRWLSKTDSLSLDFDGVDFSKFIDEDGLIGDLERMCNLVCQRSKKPVLIESTVWGVTAILARTPAPRQLCCGHDMVEVLRIALRKRWGTRNASDVSEERLSQMLRLAYTRVDFTRTALYQRMFQRRFNVTLLCIITYVRFSLLRVATKILY